MIADTPEAYAAQIAENPDYYTVIQFRGRGKYDRDEFDQFNDAAEFAKSNRRAMIYAVKGGKETLLDSDGKPATGKRRKS